MLLSKYIHLDYVFKNTLWRKKVINLLKGELDFLLMQHLFNTTDLKHINKNAFEDNESIAA